MPKNYFRPLIGRLSPERLHLKCTSQQVLYAMSFLIFVLQTQRVLGQGNSTWGSVNPPTTTETLKDLGSLGKIYKATWTGSNTLANTEQILHMAELDFSTKGDYELKIAYIYNDPFKLPNEVPVDPAECKEVCYYITCTGGPECKNGLQRFCEPVPGGQFDFVSHIAAKYGAVMATNGAFYDYFYNCVPGVKSYIKIDGHEFSKPNILNHRNEGALAFDFGEATPKIDIFQRTATTLEDLDSGNLYHSTTPARNISSYPNIMSGGHLNDKPDVSPYVVNIPDFCNGITYPWSNDSRYTGANDILQKSGAVWRNFACPTIPNTGVVDTPLKPSTYGYQNFFKCSNLNNLQKRKQLTCVDYAKFGEEFGGTDGLAKRSRTFIALKGKKLFWFVADGCIDKTPNGLSRCKGFTIGELDKFARDMGFDKMLNFDGGSSSAFYLNGKGILQFQYDPNAPVSNKRVGPQAQRLLQSVLMLVPSGKNLSDVYDNVKTDYANVYGKSFIDLSPTLEKINTGGLAGVFGRFKTRELIHYDKPTSPGINNYGRILYSMVKDENKVLNEAVIAGVGNIPSKLHQLLQTQATLHTGISGITKSEFDSYLVTNSFYYWAFKIEEGKIVAYDIYPQTDNSYDFLSSTPKPFDGEWHDFMLMGNGYNYDCFSCGGNNRYTTEFALWFDDWPETLNYSIKGSVKQRELQSGNLFVSNATNISVGAMVYNGEYIFSTHDMETMSFQDFVFTKNFDNYYEYSDTELTDGKEYGDPSKEYKYLRSKNWNSNLYDEIHHNETEGDDGNTIFCFDEKEDSKLAYAWYRGKNTRKRQVKTYGTYVGNADTYTDHTSRAKRSADESDLARALYHIVNEDNGLKLQSYHNPSNNRGIVSIQSDEVISTAKTNRFLVESMGEKRFLISNMGIYTINASGNSVGTQLDFSPNDLYNYWDFEPGLVPGRFYIKHNQTGKYLTGGKFGANNVSLANFNSSKSQQWSLEKVGEAKEVIVPNYYKVENVSNNQKYSWRPYRPDSKPGEGNLSFIDINHILPYSDPKYQGVWVDYVGAGFYNFQMRYNGKGAYLEFSTNNTAHGVINEGLLDNRKGGLANIYITFKEHDEVEFHKTIIKDNQFKTLKVHNFYDTTYNARDNASEQWFVSINNEDVPEKGGSYEGKLWSDTTFNLSLIETAPKEITPLHYEISSLAHQDLVASHFGNQVLAQADDNSMSNQVWDFHYIGLGRYMILQPDAPSYSNVNSNKWVPTTTYSDRKAFEVIINEDGSSTLKYNGQCLTDNGSGQEYSFTNCTAANNQKYILYLNKYHELNTIDRGYYRIVNENSKKALIDNTGNVEQYTYTGDNDFKDEWLIEPMGNDEYLISNRKNFKSMDVKFASMANNANIWTYFLNKTPAQRWKIKRHGQGFYQIENSKSSKCLDVNLEGAGDGANIKQLFCRSLTDPYVGAQQFAIEFVGEATLPIEKSNINYTLQNHAVSGNGAAGIFPVRFNNEDAITYGDYKHVNKSDLWSFDYQGAQLYMVQLKSTGKMLTISNTSVNGSYDMVQRTLSILEEKPEQMWALTDNFNGHEPTYGEYTIASAKRPALNLQVASYGVNGSKSMHVGTSSGNTGDWKLIPSVEPSFDIYNRISPQGSGLVLAIPTPNLNQVIQAPPYYDDGAWRFEKLEDGYYRFINKYRTDKVMSAGNLTTDDIKAVTWNASNNKQRWSIENISDGDPYYRIVNKATSLSIYWPTLLTGTKTKTGSWNDGENKFKWKILKYIKYSGASSLRAKTVLPLKEELQQFVVFPNPSQGEINVDLSLFKNKNFKTLRFNFHDLSGRFLYGSTRTVDLKRNPTVQFTDLTSKGVFKGFIILNIVGPDDKVVGSKNIIFR